MSESMCLAVQAVTAAALLSTVATADEAALQPGKPKMVWTQPWAPESPFGYALGGGGAKWAGSLWGSGGQAVQGLASASRPWPLPLSAAGSTATATATTTAAAAAAAVFTTAMHPGEQQQHHHHQYHHQHQQQPLPPTGATAAALPVSATVAVPSQSLADLSLEAIALAREGMCRGIALLAARQHLGRERTERFL